MREGQTNGRRFEKRQDAEPRERSAEAQRRQGFDRHEHAQGLPSWDLEPPARLLRRGRS